MTDTNLRDLIWRLTEKLDYLQCYYNVPDQSALIAEARAYLDQSVPEEPTDEELLEAAADAVGYEHVPTDETCLSLARAVLARWGK